MKHFVKTYSLLWLKCLTLAPALVMMSLSRTIINVYTLAAAAVLGDAGTFNQIYEDSLYD